MATRQIDMIGKLEQTYAMALLELAEATGGGALVDEVAEEMRQIGVLIEQQPELVHLMSTRTLSVEQRRQVIDSLFSGRTHDLVRRFLQIVNHKNRLNHLAGIVRAFADLLNQKRGIVAADAFVATKLDAASAERVGSRVGEILGKKIVLTQYEDPSLVGGLKLRIGDRLIDGSVATQLKLIREKMVKTGRERARGQMEQPL